MTDNRDEEYLFIIYSCKKNLLNAERVYERVNGKLVNCKVYICYGIEEDESNKIIDDKYFTLKCSDDYDHLSDKTLLLLILKKYKLSYIRYKYKNNFLFIKVFLNVNIIR